MDFKLLGKRTNYDVVRTLKLKKRTSFDSVDESRIPWDADCDCENATGLVGTHQYITNKQGQKELLKLLPDVLVSREIPRVSIVRLYTGDADRNMLPWHTDYGRTAVINWYIQTNGEETKYESGSFIANDGDLYVMAGNVNHCVLMTKGIREMVSYSYSDLNVNDIIEAHHAN